MYYIQWDLTHLDYQQNNMLFKQEIIQLDLHLQI